MTTKIDFHKISMYVDSHSSEFTPQELACISSLYKRKAREKIMRDPNYQQKEQQITSQVFFTAYEYMLDNNEPAKDCLIHAAEKHLKDIEKVLAEKSNQCGKMTSVVVKGHDEHPVQKDMIKRGKFNRQALKNSKNIWQLLNTLSTFRSAYQDLLDFEKAIQVLRNDLDHTQQELVVAKSEIERLNQSVGLSEMTAKERAGYLKQLGYTQKDVAKYVEKSLRTIERWWDNL